MGDESMESLYAGSEDMAGGEGGKKTVDEEEREEMDDEAVIPLKVIQPPDGSKVKKGDEIVVQVVEVYGDQTVKIKYAPPEEEEPEEEHEGMDHEGMHEGEEEGAGDELDRMSSMY